MGAEEGRASAATGGRVASVAMLLPKEPCPSPPRVHLAPHEREDMCADRWQDSWLGSLKFYCLAALPGTGNHAPIVIDPATSPVNDGPLLVHLYALRSECKRMLPNPATTSHSRPPDVHRDRRTYRMDATHEDSEYRE